MPMQRHTIGAGMTHPQSRGGDTAPLQKHPGIVAGPTTHPPVVPDSSAPVVVGSAARVVLVSDVAPVCIVVVLVPAAVVDDEPTVPPVSLDALV